MGKLKWKLSLLLILCYGEISAQVKQWTLEDCINYAVTNNIGLQRQHLQTETDKVNLLTARLNVLPTLNLGSNAQVAFGRSVDPTSNLITFSQNLLNSFYANSDINLFAGFTRANTMSANKFMLKAGLEQEKVARNTLVIDIMGQYYQYLYARGLEDASKMQLDLSEKQLFRIRKMVETGKEALAKQYEMESQVSADRLSYTIAVNNSNKALTSLKQTLQLQSGTEFEILMPDINNIMIMDASYKTDSVYSLAAQNLPRLRSLEYELKASGKRVAAAKGAIAPRISAGGSVSTGYFNALNDTSSKISYNRQLKNNVGQQVYVSLNIPIFNNYTTGRNIRLAKINRKDTELRLAQERNNLYTDVENACLEYNRGKAEYMAAISNLEYNRKSFDAVEKKFESGLVDVTDYSAAKTTLFKAETDELRTKLQLLIRKLSIEFYSSGEYENLVK